MKTAVFLVILLAFPFSCLVSQQPVVIAYAGGYNGKLISTDKMEADKLTHLLYAFANLRRDGTVYLQYPATDKTNLTRLVALKKVNPALKVLLSVGGLGWSVNFSNVSANAESRNRFSLSCAKLVQQFNLDGIDLDWEFPGYAGEGGDPYQEADKHNFTLLCQALRSALHAQQQRTAKVYTITAATDGWASHYLPHTEMDKVQASLDYVLLMTYNFNKDGLAGGHYLYSPHDWYQEGSVDGAVNAFMAAGVPASKLVAGAGFFPAALLMYSTAPADRSYVKKQVFKGGLARVARLNRQDGFIRYWDTAAKSPFLFNPVSRVRIAYEDSASVEHKCAYILRRQLAGIMYWEYFLDPGGRLLNVINNSFRNK